MSPSGGPLFRRPPSLRPRHSFPPWTVLCKLGGVLLTLVVLLFLLLTSPVIITLRIIGFLKRKSRRWNYKIRICSHQWPLSGKSPDLGLLSLTSEVDDTSLNFNINDVSLGEDEFAGEQLFGLGSESIAKLWNHGERRLKYSKDLVAILNDSSVFSAERMEIRVVDEYSDPGRSSCLVLTSMPPQSCVCTPRLFSVISNQKMYLEMEPLPSYHFFVPIRHTYCFHNFIIVSFRLLTSGPSSLLSLLLKRPSPLWRQLTGETRRKRKRRNVRTRDSSGTDTAPEEIVVHSKENGSLRASSLLSQEPSSNTHYRCWRALPNSDLVGRAERLLRATSAEMMLALISGALRGYCREQGLTHPPDLGALVPISCRNFLPIACGYPCDVMTFPLVLPTGVEGTIPRIWTIQRRLFEGLNGHKPAALKIAQLLVRTCSTQENAASWMRPLFSSHSIHVAFYRASGDFKISGISSIDSMMYFPSLDENIKASFVFIQCGRNTQVCASLCRKTFPDPNALLNHFEKETRHLLDHLSLRLLSLPQSTFLPGQFAVEEPPETMTSASEYLREKTTPKKTEPGECSLEELHELLATVQTELDGMRSNPQGDRAEYIRKLSALETRMQQFHDSITERLGVEGAADPEGGQVVETILAPYRPGPESSQERRYSRDSSRSEEQRMRKASRSSI